MATSIEEQGRYQDGNSIFENVFIQGTLNVATANEKLVVHSNGITIDTITTNSDGDVGINSTAPATKLDIGGHLQVRNSTDDAAKIFLRDESGSYDYYQIRNHGGNFLIRNSTKSHNDISVLSTGRVGINSSIPSATLDVQDVTDDNSIPVLLLGGGGNDNGDLAVNSGEILQTGHFDRGTGTFTERFRFGTLGALGISGANYGTSGQVLASQGSSASPQWVDAVVRPGQIIETLVGVCDGNDVTVKSGTYTLANVNVEQALTNTHTTISGSSIDYAPPAGTTRVCYEFWVYMKDAGSGTNSRPIVHFRSQLDNSSGTATIINNSRHTWRFAHQIDQMDVQTWVYNKVIVSIGQVSTESVANGRLVNWDSARTFRWQARRYSASYGGILHETNNWDGAGTDIRVRPHVKITAIA